MTTKQAMQRAFLIGRLDALGFTWSEGEELIRIERTLQRWGERECGSEYGAIRRLAKIMSLHPDLVAYHQGDCRGCNLYILRRDDIRDGEEISSVYTRGLAVCA